MDKKGEMQNAYSPLQNLIDKNLLLGDFTTNLLNFDLHTPIDIILTDEYDGSQNLILNDDKNNPRLINTRFSQLENNTFNIPFHSGNVVTNIYEENTFNKDTQLIKLYTTIPLLIFDGILGGGGFSCGSYVFYFKLSDADGNLSNVVQESGIVLLHIGTPNTKKVRMGMQDENSQKSVKFTLKNIDSGFDYVKVFYERASTDSSQSIIKLYYMIDLNFPIVNNQCTLVLTGEENMLPISKSDLQTEYADIQTARTLSIVDNTLFLGNVSAYELDYQMLQLVAWRIIPSVVKEDCIGVINSRTHDLIGSGAYYNVDNVYNNTGYWGEEYYRFGVVFIYNNNLTSPVFNILGCDLTKEDNIPETAYFQDNGDKWENEPEDYFFNKKYLTNSKGVVKLPKTTYYTNSNELITPRVTKIKFNWANTIYKHKDKDSNNNVFEKISELGLYSKLFESLNIKGLFFVRQKRIPTIIAQGMVVGLTGKDNGAIPVLKANNGSYCTKSFLDYNRLLQSKGSTVLITDSNKVETKALLVPDYDVNEATLNLVFTSLKFQLLRIANITNKIDNDHHYAHLINNGDSDDFRIKVSDVKLTAVPKNTKIKTDGENYFSSIAGDPNEAFKTEDVNNIWNETPPQKLTVSTSLIRGLWGSYVGMSSNDFQYGDVVNIRMNDFKNEENHNILEFLKRFNDFSLYSAISPRINILDYARYGSSLLNLTCARGDCFCGVFTHRMMSNFIDPELPTNKKIINPGCWASNYAVRCTAEIKSSTTSTLADDSEGWWCPIDEIADRKGGILLIVLGALTGQIGMVISGISDLNPTSNPVTHELYANEIVKAYEIYTDVTADLNYKDIVQDKKIKKLQPQEQESSGGFNLKALFKPDDKWEMHGLASINRADVNAVSFGSWITFPICSQYNLAFRDIDFDNATEEASMNRKRAFYPYEEMDPENHLLESGVINGATKVSVSDYTYSLYTTVPYVKQEYFNRIYWSKPNVTLNFINSYRMIFNSQYKEYNKEFGAISKTVSLGNSLLVVFLHGIGLLTVNRSPLTQQEASPYLPSNGVLPTLVATLTSDFGSMWKDSVLKTPDGFVYGVDTVAKKIWRVHPTGKGLEFISDHKVTKFLNDHITLSEFDYNVYQGHINVKTHYNAFKKDVMFTYYRDTPMTRHLYVKITKGKNKGLVLILPIGSYFTEDNYECWWKVPNEDTEYQVRNEDGIIEVNTPENGWVNESEFLTDDMYQPVDLSGNLILSDTLDPKPLIEKWEKGETWNLCYNEVLQKWVTFYDWYPIESCNVDNIYFSFNKDEIDSVYNKEEKINAGLELDSDSIFMNKVFIDKAFTHNTKVYIDPNIELRIYVSRQGTSKISFYYESFDENNIPILYYKNSEDNKIEYTSLLLGKDPHWKFAYAPVTENVAYVHLKNNGCKIAEVKMLKEEPSNLSDPVLQYWNFRKSEANQMYLWKHGQAGLYDNQGKIKPTHWYGKLHEWNFEFIVNELPGLLKVFNNLSIISNKAAPYKFEYEVVGEGYDWYIYKKVINWANDLVGKLKVNSVTLNTLESVYEYILKNSYGLLRDKDPTFPELFGFDDGLTIKKLPFLPMKLQDLINNVYYYQDKDKWLNDTTLNKYPDSSNNNKETIDASINKGQYTWNTSDVCLIEDEQLNEEKVHTEQLGQDMKKYGRLRGNMSYLEDNWKVEIRPISFKYAYLDKDCKIAFSKKYETRHRDKFIRIKLRYDGKDLALVQSVNTLFDYSFA